MAKANFTWFAEGKMELERSSFATTDVYKLALLTSAAAPTVPDVSPSLTSYTEVNSGGTYTAGGIDIGTLEELIYIFNSKIALLADEYIWDAHASNSTDAEHLLIYNSTDAGKAAACYASLAAAFDMTAKALHIGFNQAAFLSVDR